MKKEVFLMLPCIAAIAIATFVGKKSFVSNLYEGNELLVQNVEALSSSGEDDYDSSVCNTGGEHNAIVEVATGKVQARVHYNDGINGTYGLDEVFDINYKRCCAYGIGTKKGGNYSWVTGKGTSTHVECIGPQGHYMPTL